MRRTIVAFGFGDLLLLAEREALANSPPMTEAQTDCPAAVQSAEILGVWKVKKWRGNRGRLNISKQVTPEEFEGELTVECPRSMGCYRPLIVEGMKIVLSGSSVKMFATSMHSDGTHEVTWYLDGFLLTICNGTMSGRSLDIMGNTNSAVFVRQ
jgi:hypothetical protein